MRQETFRKIVNDLVDDLGDRLDLSNFDLYAVYPNFTEYFREFFKNYLDEDNILYSDYTEEDLENCLIHLSDDFLYESDYPGGFWYEKDKLFDLVKGVLLEDFSEKVLQSYEADEVINDILYSKIKYPDIYGQMKRDLDMCAFRLLDEGESYE